MKHGREQGQVPPCLPFTPSLYSLASSDLGSFVFHPPDGEDWGHTLACLSGLCGWRLGRELG